MNEITIQKLIITDSHGSKSELDFNTEDEKFTIIYGPSNTGKSLSLRCVDYCLGGSDYPLPDGYDSIELSVICNDLPISIKRTSTSKNISIYESPKPSIEVDIDGLK